MGSHMDIRASGGAGIQGGGTYEGAYDNTGGTVSMMLFLASDRSISSAIRSSPSGRARKRALWLKMHSNKITSTVFPATGN